MRLSEIFHHPLPLTPVPATRALYLGFNRGLNPQTPFLDHIVPRLATVSSIFCQCL